MKRVLVLQREHLLTGGIASLLSHAEDIDVFEESVEDDSLLLKTIQSLKPTVVITDNRLKYPALYSVIDMLNQIPELRFIVVDDQKNKLHIYEVQERTITQVNDLVDAIHSQTPAK